MHTGHSFVRGQSMGASSLGMPQLSLKSLVVDTINMHQQRGAEQKLRGAQPRAHQWNAHAKLKTLDLILLQRQMCPCKLLLVCTIRSLTPTGGHNCIEGAHYCVYVKDTLCAIVVYTQHNVVWYTHRCMH